MLRHSSAAVAARWLAALGAIVLAGNATAQSQTWNFDWSKRPTEEGSTTKAPDLALSSPETVTLKITEVNQILYTYSMSCTATETSSPTALWTAMFGGMADDALESAKDACKPELGKLQKEIEAYRNSPAQGEGKKPKSISLADSRKAVKGFLERAQKLAGEVCAGDTGVAAIVENLEQLLDRGEFVTFQQTISPDYEYICTVSEAYKGKATENGTLRIAINPSNAITTLSIGALASAVPSRSFEVVTAPNADNTGATNVLGVQGDSMSANVATLFNFRLPWVKALNGDKWGVDATVGPVFRVGSGGDTSSVGVFGGLSLRLYKYLFITPGVHLAPVADYPIGFSRPGQLIPPNFGTPTAVQRTTARFGVAVSVRTKDFGKLGGSRVTSLPVIAPPKAAEAEGSGAEEESDPSVEEQDQPNISEVEMKDKSADGVYTGSLKIPNPSTNKTDWKITLGKPDGVTLEGQESCSSIKPAGKCEVTIKATKPSDSESELSLILRLEHLSTPKNLEVKLVFKDAE